MDGMIPLLAGAVSTVIFAGGTLPMLVKAARTKDLSSYSLGNIVLSNLGNVIQSIYVFHLPAGPMWVLHTFYLLSTALMLFWYLRYTPSPVLGRRSGLVRSPAAARLARASVRGAVSVVARTRRPRTWIASSRDPGRSPA